jgi:hypothetical protein
VELVPVFREDLEELEVDIDLTTLKANGKNSYEYLLPEIFVKEGDTYTM